MLQEVLSTLRDTFPELSAYSDASLISYAQQQGLLTVSEWFKLSSQISCEEREA